MKDLANGEQKIILNNSDDYCKFRSALDKSACLPDFDKKSA